VEKKLAYFLLFAGFWLEILPQLNIKAVHNLKTKGLGIILSPWAIFEPISTSVLFLVSEVECRDQCAHFGRFWHFGAYFWCFLANFATIKQLVPKI